MSRKIVWVLIAAVLGAVLGGVLGYGPLLRYKSEGVLGMEMAPAEYKRFTELANSPASLRQLISVLPLPGLTAADMEHLETVVTQGGWHTPIPKISSADAKLIPDALLQMSLNDKDNKDNKDGVDGTSRERELELARRLRVYLGLTLSYTAHDPAQAAQVATWLGNYFKQVATREALRSQVYQWAADSREFSDRAVAQKLQYAFDIEQAQSRAKALKVIVASYPGAARSDSQQVVDVRKDNEKFMTPMAQLVAAESEVIGIQDKLRQLERKSEQQAFAKPLIAQAEVALSQAQSGSDAVTRVSTAIAQFAGTASTDADKEKLASMASDVSQIGARFLSLSQYIAVPAAPTRPERPSPHMVIALGAVLAALLAAAVAWRSLLIQLLWEDDHDERTEKAA